jgi:hypothetical protein
MSQATSHESSNEAVLQADDPRDGSNPDTPPSPEPVPVLNDPPPKGGDDDQ